MKLVLAGDNIIGNVLAAPIYTPNGLIMLNSGCTLSSSIVERIKNLGIRTLYVEDDNTDISVQDMLDIKTKYICIRLLKDFFESCKRNSKVNFSVIDEIVNEIAENINLSENAFLFNSDIKDNDSLQTLCIHSIDVCLLSMQVAINRKYDRKRLLEVATGALLHDIGKMFSEGRDHTILGYNYLKNSGYFSTLITLCSYQHHEAEDGSGYPLGTAGNKIYEYSKIVSICDEYMNLVNDTRGLLPNEILEMLTVQASSRFEPSIYKSFMDSIYCYPNGMVVTLNDGRTAIVIKQNKSFPTRPILGISKDGHPELIDLMTNLTLFIEKVVL